MIFPIAAAIGILSVVTASPTSRYVVHEKREIGNSAWVPVEAKLNGRTAIPLSIGLTQRNLEKGHDFLMDVSDPTSPNYGNIGPLSR
jgi:tripeptidyl-peptidase I